MRRGVRVLRGRPPTGSSTKSPAGIRPPQIRRRGAFGLPPQFLGSTKDQYLPDSSPDPRVQGEAYDRYVGDRYGDPLKAKDHHVNAGWYERGGGVIHEGANIMLNGLGAQGNCAAVRSAGSESLTRPWRGGRPPAVLVEKLDQLISVISAMDGGTTNVTLRDERAYYERERRQQRARHKAMSGGR